jgi:3-hydroxyisobutyrate dehydrogenase-like beta-hydroxyacid dehydrogenase
MHIGFMGVGYMGHGAAKNILAKGYPLTVLGHRNRAPSRILSREAQRRRPRRWSSQQIATQCSSAFPPQ